MSVFTDAADLIKERGWHRGTYEYNTVCLMDAILTASNGAPNTHLLYNRIDTYILDHYNARGTTWNDTIAESVDDVYAMLQELDSELESNPNSLD